MRKLLFFIYEFGFLLTLFLVLICATTFEVFTAKKFPLENIKYLLIGIFFLIVLLGVYRKFYELIDGILIKYTKKLLSVSLIVLLIWQLYTLYGDFFLCEWDAGGLQKNAFRELYGEYDNLSNDYFSIYPNNLLLVWIFANILRLARILGLSHLEFSLVIFQVLIDVISILLVFIITYNLTSNLRVSWLAYLIAYFFIGLNPWFGVAYSDATGIIFPLLIIYLFYKCQKEANIIIQLGIDIIIGFVSMMGYHIKPQLLIALLAIIIVELTISFIKVRKGIFTSISSIAAICFGAFLFVTIYSSFIVPSLHLELDSNSAVSWQHYLMMGLNSENDGVYDSDDVNYSLSFSTVPERNKADIQKSIERIRSYGPFGLIYHLMRKQLVNYGDGTFAWGVEGGFFTSDPEWAHNLSSVFIHSFIRPEGTNYSLFISCEQIIWLLILFSQIFVVICSYDSLGLNEKKILAVMMLSIIGLTLFNLLFEARARYLFCYTPIYVILGALGIRNFYHIFTKYIK